MIDIINSNGELISKPDHKVNIDNRAYKYGDAIFDTLKSNGNDVFFIEDHYFRLMSSLRMLRMEIPYNFTLEFFKNEILRTLKANELDNLSRIRFSVNRENGGLYTPKTHKIDYVIEVEKLVMQNHENYEIELYKDFPVLANLISNVKTNNKMVNVLASIFSNENDLNNCVLINERKHIVEATNANIFLVNGNEIRTPSLSEGCVNGIIRKKLIEILSKSSDYKLIETKISPIELLQADEVFITNSIIDIQSVTKYRRKKYNIKIAIELKKMLGELI